MNVHEAAETARRVMDENGLGDWDLLLTHNIFELGRTDFTNRRIELSADFIRLYDEQVFLDTLYHEVGHAINPNAIPEMNLGIDPHNDEWERRVWALGASKVERESTIDNPWYRLDPKGYEFKVMIHALQELAFEGGVNPADIVVSLKGSGTKMEDD